MRKGSASASSKRHGPNVCSHNGPIHKTIKILKQPYVDAFIRDELSKGRYDPALSKVCFEMLLELFNRRLKLDLGDHDGKGLAVEDVC